jgi:hypothetical protein
VTGLTPAARPVQDSVDRFCNQVSDLIGVEKQTLETVFRMSSGFVLVFSDGSFGEFVRDTTGIDPYGPGIDASGSSNVRRLRLVCATQPNDAVGRLVSAML